MGLSTQSQTNKMTLYQGHYQVILGTIYLMRIHFKLICFIKFDPVTYNTFAINNTLLNHDIKYCLNLVNLTLAYG